MKFSLIKSLHAIGYEFINDTFFNPKLGIFYKIIKDNYCLTLGLTKKRILYPGLYDVNFFLSKTPSWSANAYLPIEAFRPVPFFLMQEERIRLLPEVYHKPKMVAGAWELKENSDIIKLVTAISITESRFLSQQNLLNKIDECEEILNKIEIIKKIIRAFKNKLEEREYYFLPEKTKDDTPIDWYKASEVVIGVNEKTNRNLLELYAIEAYRQYHYKGLMKIIGL